MVILGKELLEQKHVSKEEVDAALDKIFNGITEALRDDDKSRISLERVDETLAALFDAVNNAGIEGKNIKVPDFKRILRGEY